MYHGRATGNFSIYSFVNLDTLISPFSLFRDVVFMGFKERATGLIRAV